MTDNTTVDAELAEVNESTESTTVALDTDDSAVDSELEKTDEVSLNEVKAQKRKDSALGTIRKVEGMLAKGEDIPKELQWAVAQIDHDAIEPVEKSAVTVDVQSVIERHEAKKQFEVDKTQLTGLSKELRNSLTEDANSLKAELVISIEKALRHVMNKAQADITKDAESAGNRKAAASLPNPGKLAKGDSISMDQLSNLEPKEYNRIMKLVDTGEVTVV